MEKGDLVQKSRIGYDLDCWLADAVSRLLLQMGMPLKMGRAGTCTMQGCSSDSASSFPIKLVQRTWHFINILRPKGLKIMTPLLYSKQMKKMSSLLHLRVRECLPS